MIINKLTLYNHGLFRGLHTFNLTPKSSNGNSKSIILIGGKNGAGKTTLFEAVRLCLYGQNYLGTRIRKKDYEKYLSDKIHNIVGSSIQPFEAYIEVEFEYSHLGQINNYVIKRSWHRKESKTIENLTINKNGEHLNEIEIDHWQDFLNELIPQGISKLFFFDGEKIQQLADEEDNNRHLKDSFKSLLRLDIVERLQADLGIYSSRHLKDIGIPEIQKDIIGLNKEHQELEDKLDGILQNRAQKQSHFDQIIGEIERQELKISGEGGGFASKRDELKKTRIKLDADIDNVKSQIRELSSNLLPFAITPKFCKILKSHLVEEEQFQKFTVAQETLDLTLKEVEDKIKSSSLWNDLSIPDSTQQTITERVFEIINDTKTIPDNFKNYRPLHQLSPVEQQKILVWIDQALEGVPEQLVEFTRKLERLTRKRQKVENSLNSAPDDDVLNPLIKKLIELNQELGQLQEQIEVKDGEVSKIEFKLEDCSRRIQLQLDKIESHSELSTRLKLANQAQTVLKEYIIDLQKEKIEEFSQAFLTCFNRLLRKGNFIRKIDIDVDDFSIVLYDPDGKAKSKSQLSDGEKQIYAISMLWALTQTSGRPLPFIIDTPLGRLDSDHRSSLVMDFFPNASHQMIIFSTDTEIDKQYFDDLSPYIERAFHLEYCEDEGMTKTTEEYFWNKKEVEVIHELQ